MTHCCLLLHGQGSKEMQVIDNALLHSNMTFTTLGPFLTTQLKIRPDLRQQESQTNFEAQAHHKCSHTIPRNRASEVILSTPYMISTYVHWHETYHMTLHSLPCLLSSCMVLALVLMTSTTVLLLCRAWSSRLDTCPCSLL